MDLNDFPEARAVRITVAGTLTGQHLKDASQNRVFGPNGWNCVATVSVTYSGTGSVGPTCGNPGTADPISSIVKVQGHGVVTRGGPWSTQCYDQSGPCWSFIGSQQVSVEVVDYSATVTAWSSSKQRVVNSIPLPEWLYFSWKPDSTNGAPPKQGFEWRWVPDDGSKPDTLFQWYGYETNVQYRPTKSGTMYVRVKINGIEKTLSTQVFVGKVNLQLTAKPTRVIKGKSARFRATVTPVTLDGKPVPFSINSWEWQNTGEPFAPACPGSTSECTRGMARSGRMRVIGTVNDGQVDTAFAKVDVFDCDTTGVPELDDLDMRDSLDAWYARRQALQREGVVVIWSDGTGGYLWQELTTPNADACHTGSFTETLSSAQRMGVAVHPHVYRKGEVDDMFLPLDCYPVDKRAPDGCDLVVDVMDPSKTNWTCTNRSRRLDPFGNPAGDDVKSDPGWPTRDAVIDPASVTAWKPVPRIEDFTAGDVLTRRSRRDWRSCTNTPI